MGFFSKTKGEELNFKPLDDNTLFHYFPNDIREIFKTFYTHYPANPNFEKSPPEKKLKQFNQALGEKDFADKVNTDDYDNNSSLIFDTYMMQLPEIFYSKYKSNKESWFPPTASNPLSVTFIEFMYYFYNDIKDSAEYLDIATWLPHIVSDRMYEKMQWFEWLLTELQKALKNYEATTADKKNDLIRLIESAVQNTSLKIDSYARYRNRYRIEAKDLLDSININKEIKEIKQRSNFAAALAPPSPAPPIQATTIPAETNLVASHSSPSEPPIVAKDTSTTPASKFIPIKNDATLTGQSATPTSTETDMPSTEKLTNLFKKIYTALRAGQSSIFKTNFLSDKDNLSPEELEKAIIQRFYDKPNGRTSEAWALANTYSNENNQLALFKAIYLMSFEHSGFLKMSSLTKNSIFRSKTLKISLESLTEEELYKHVNGKKNRAAAICAAMDFKFSESVVNPQPKAKI